MGSGAVMLQDIWLDRRVLLAKDAWRRELIGLVAGENKERDVSWLDCSYPNITRGSFSSNP